MTNLVHVVDETMKPDLVILWLPKPFEPIFQSGLNDNDKLAGSRDWLEEKHA